jgi:serine/threonine protein kinase
MEQARLGMIGATITSPRNGGLVTTLRAELVIGERYQLERELGKGGMGSVWVARDLRLNRPVALKVMAPELAGSVDLSERFIREAQFLARVSDDHVVPIYDAGTIDKVTPYIVMQLMEGVDLARLLKERTRLPISEAVDYLLQACMAMASAHALNIIHRDLKPANLFLEKRGTSQRIKVLDFGIAKVLNDDPVVLLTRANQPMGTPGYMAPEQHDARPDVGKAADIWALGVILYELVSGQPAFFGDSFLQIAKEVVWGQPKPLAELILDPPPALVAVIDGCLKKKPEERFQSVSELAAALAPLGLSDADQRAKLVQKLSNPMLPPAGESVRPPAAANDAQASDQNADPPAPLRTYADSFGAAADLLKVIDATPDITFLVGGGLHTESGSTRGIVGSSELIDRLGTAYASSIGQQTAFQKALGTSARLRYPLAIGQFRSKPALANQVIGLAVTDACVTPVQERAANLVRLEQTAGCLALEDEPSNWRLSDAVKTLAALLGTSGNRFSSTCLTTNFDPLIEVAVQERAGAVQRILLKPDGSPNHDRDMSGTERRVQVVHLHGDWMRQDALHTVVVTRAERTGLKFSIHEYLRRQVLLVIGHSGSDLQLLDALVQSLKASGGCRELWWTFREADPKRVANRYSHLIDYLVRNVAPEQLRLFCGVTSEALFKTLRPSLRPAPVVSPSGTVVMPPIKPPEKPPTGQPPSTLDPTSGGGNGSPPPPSEIRLPAIAMGIALLLLALLVAKFDTDPSKAARAVHALIAVVGVSVAFFGGFPGFQANIQQTTAGKVVNLSGPVLLLVILLPAFGFPIEIPGIGRIGGGDSGGSTSGGGGAGGSGGRAGDAGQANATSGASAGGAATAGATATGGTNSVVSNGGAHAAQGGSRTGGGGRHSQGKAGASSVAAGGKPSTEPVDVPNPPPVDVAINLTLPDKDCKQSVTTVIWPKHTVEPVSPCRYKVVGVPANESAVIVAQSGKCCHASLSAPVTATMNLELKRNRCTEPKCTKGGKPCPCNEALSCEEFPSCQ